MGVRKSAAGFAVLAVLVLLALWLSATLGQAASVRIFVAVKASPHGVTEGEKGFFTATVTNTGPSAVNHTTVTVGKAFVSGGVATQVLPMPLPASAFSGLPTACSAVASSPTTSLVTCNLGQVKTSVNRLVLPFTVPSAHSADPFPVGVSVSYDERKDTANQDTKRNFDKFPFSSLDSGNAAVTGKCEAVVNTETAVTESQETSIDPPELNLTSFPCTPVTVGVDLDAIPNSGDVPEPFGEVSFVDFLGEAGLAEVKVAFLEGIPAGVNKNNIQLFELPQFPISLEATNDGAPVPACVEIDDEFQIPPGSGFFSCILGNPRNIPGGGIEVTLLAQGGEDSGWGGIG